MSRLLAILAISGAASVSVSQTTTQLVINEICSCNNDQWVDPSFNYGGWVEFYNPTSSAISITNWRLSDDPNNLRRARITQSTSVPAHGYKVVWFDSYHPRYSPKTVDMKLNLDGGTLYVSDANGNLLLQQDYPAAVARCSWARTTDGSNEWRYCANPSLGSKNDGHKFADERLAKPEVEGDSQVFSTGKASFHVIIPEGCTLRYTTDGSAPTERNGQISTDGNFSTSATQLYRFALFADGYLPSEVVTRSCIRSTLDIDLPILSVTSTHRNFYSDSIGIFVRGGINGRPGRGQSTKCNYNMDWERPAVFEYFTPSGEILYNQETGIERCGGWSRAWSPNSFKIKANKRYEGHKSLDYPFFAEKPYLKQKTLQIRNGGNDNNCRVRDPFLQRIISSSGINVDYQSYQPVAHFINGQWKGTINMREPNNKHFVYANFGYDDDEIDQFEMSPDSGYVQNCGTTDAWKNLVSYAKQSSNPDYYDKVCELLDIEEFCNYMAIEFYLRNWDWPQNNVKAWRPRLDENGRFRFVLFDLDGFDGCDNPFTTFNGKQNYTFDWLYDLNRRLTKEIELVTIFNNLLNNATFRQRFIDTFALVAYSVFEPSRCKTIINELANRVSHTQALYNNESPWDTSNKLVSALSAARQTQLMQQLKNYSRFKLSSAKQHAANIRTDVDCARLTFNGLPIPLNVFNGKYYGDLTVGASAPVGYEFVGWKNLKSETTTIFPTNHTWKYYDKGSLNNTGWQKAAYDDSSWSSGQAPLGYFTDGSRDYKTTLDYGTNKNSKRPTYYFRTRFTLAHEPQSGDVFTLDYMIDDGVVIYVNGIEAARHNMPSGNITYNTYASTYAPGNPDTGSMTLPSSLFQKGENLIAVELHNNSASSSDVYWSASLSIISYTGDEIVSTEPSYTLPSTDQTQSLIASFRPAADLSSIPPVVINEISAGNDVCVNDYQKKADWIELYNTRDYDIDLSGCYLSDRADKPYKYCISANDTEVSTVIPAHGYMIIWCDKAETLRQLHASFKLDNDDKQRQVILTAADGSWHDVLSYYHHDINQSVGRYPDGSSDVYLMTRTTIDNPNELSLYSEVVAQPAPEAIQRVLSDFGSDAYYVYDLSGRIVAEGHGTCTLRDLQPGAYIIRSGVTASKVIIE